MNRNTLLVILAIAIGIIVWGYIPDRGEGGFTAEERALIRSTDSTFRVLTVEDSLDNAILRSASTNLSPKTIKSRDFVDLCNTMLRTVTHPSQDGVGIAAPQIGINRRVVAVQRFDKPGEPFEVYGNIRITEFLGEKTLGPEGCLSVPDRREDVDRYQDIIIEYAHEGKLVTERVSGFTAVIFQHEVDHLEGILYIDRVDK